MIAGLGEKTDFVAVVPNLDPTRLNLTAEEAVLFSRIGRAVQISELIALSGMPEAKTIAILLSLRAKGAVVPARITKPPSGPMPAAAMLEEVDLSEERKREILELETALDVKDHFSVLGITPGTTPDEIRRTFYELSRKYHPDRYFQKSLGSFRARIEVVYRKLTHAYETVHDPVRRAVYLKARPEVAASEPVKQVARSPDAPPPKAHVDDARDAERRARFARHPYFAKGARMKELLDRARDHIAKGDWDHAFTDVHMAYQIDSTNEEAKKLLAEVRAQNDAQRSRLELQRGMDLLDQGNEHGALSAFKSAVHIDPKNGKAAFMTAKLMWDRSHEQKETLGFAQRAVDADPKNADFHLLIARIMDQTGHKALAKRHYEEALKLDPKSSEAKKHVKGRWPF